MMKICDIYPYLYTYLEMINYLKLEVDQFDKDIFHYLTKINVELPNQAVKSSSKVKFKLMYKKNEDLGQKVSRNLFNEKFKNKDADLNKEVNGETNFDDSIDSNLNESSNKQLNGVRNVKITKLANEKVEIRMLIKEFKRKQLIKKAKRRKLIRENLKFDVI